MPQGLNESEPDSPSETLRKTEAVPWDMSYFNSDENSEQPQQSPFGEVDSAASTGDSLPSPSLTLSVWEKRFSKKAGKALPAVLFDQNELVNEEKNRTISFTDENEWVDSEGEEDHQTDMEDVDKSNSSDEKYLNSDKEEIVESRRQIKSKGFFRFFCCGGADDVVNPVKTPV